LAAGLCLPAGRHSRNSTGNATGREQNGRSTTIAAITKQLPRPVFFAALADPSCCHAAPNTFEPARRKSVSSTTTRTGSPSPTNRATMS
jgi:hypothetical protein